MLYQSKPGMRRDVRRVRENVLENECSVKEFHARFVAVGEERVGRSNDVDEHADLCLNQWAKSHTDLREIPLRKIFPSMFSAWSTTHAHHKTIDDAFVLQIL